MSENVANTLCYALGLITGILFLVLSPYNQNRTTRFHAFQSIFLNLAWIGLWIALSLITIPLSAMIPLVGAMISLLLHMVIGFGFFILWLYMLFKTYNNERIVLPVVGPLAEKQANS